jgi:hypothetical protein
MGILYFVTNGVNGQGSIWDGKWECRDYKDYGGGNVPVERVCYYSKIS